LDLEDGEIEACFGAAACPFDIEPGAAVARAVSVDAAAVTPRRNSCKSVSNELMLIALMSTTFVVVSGSGGGGGDCDCGGGAGPRAYRWAAATDTEVSVLLLLLRGIGVTAFTVDAAGGWF
jgi:hypothetical protein